MSTEEDTTNTETTEGGKRKRSSMNISLKPHPKSSWRTTHSRSRFSIPSGVPRIRSHTGRVGPSSHDKRMSTTLAAQLIKERSYSMAPLRADNSKDDTFLAGYLVRQWAYTLGAELAQHVVGVFKDPSSAAYRRRWDSEAGNRVMPSNPWYLLPDQCYFLPPFFCGQITARLPDSMRNINSALQTVSRIVTRRNEFQHVGNPEDLYSQIRWFKQQGLMRHLVDGDKLLHDFLMCDKLLADWFLGTPRIYRLAGQLMFDARCSLQMSESEKWADCKFPDILGFLENFLVHLENCSSKEWYKHKWPTTIEELASNFDEIEWIDGRFGPKLEKRWRGVDVIHMAYEMCNESHLLTPAVRRFCSLPCALLENSRNSGLR